MPHKKRPRRDAFLFFIVGGSADKEGADIVQVLDFPSPDQGPAQEEGAGVSAGGVDMAQGFRQFIQFFLQCSLVLSIPENEEAVYSHSADDGSGGKVFSDGRSDRSDQLSPAAHAVLPAKGFNARNLKKDGFIVSTAGMEGVVVVLGGNHNAPVAQKARFFVHIEAADILFPVLRPQGL